MPLPADPPDMAPIAASRYFLEVRAIWTPLGLPGGYISVKGFNERSEPVWRSVLNPTIQQVGLAIWQDRAGADVGGQINHGRPPGEEPLMDACNKPDQAAREAQRRLR